MCSNRWICDVSHVQVPRHNSGEREPDVLPYMRNMWSPQVGGQHQGRFQCYCWQTLTYSCSSAVISGYNFRCRSLPSCTVRALRRGDLAHSASVQVFVVCRALSRLLTVLLAAVGLVYLIARAKCVNHAQLLHDPCNSMMHRRNYTHALTIIHHTFVSVYAQHMNLQKASFLENKHPFTFCAMCDRAMALRD